MRYAEILTAFLALLILTGCNVTKQICPCEAPEVIRMGKKEIEINAQVSLVDSTASSKIRVLIWLTNTDHTALPENFEADYYYLRSSDMVRDAFEGKFTRKNTDKVKGVMELEANNAPHWGKGELVDIAVHLTDSRGKIHFLKKGNLPVLPAKP
jgi:hypothetical protein